MNSIRILRFQFSNRFNARSADAASFTIVTPSTTDDGVDRDGDDDRNRVLTHRRDSFEHRDSIFLSCHCITLYKQKGEYVRKSNFQKKLKKSLSLSLSIWLSLSLESPSWNFTVSHMQYWYPKKIPSDVE